MEPGVSAAAAVRALPDIGSIDRIWARARVIGDQDRASFLDRWAGVRFASLNGGDLDIARWEFGRAIESVLTEEVPVLHVRIEGMVRMLQLHPLDDTLVETAERQLERTLLQVQGWRDFEAEMRRAHLDRLETMAREARNLGVAEETDQAFWSAVHGVARALGRGAAACEETLRVAREHVDDAIARDLYRYDPSVAFPPTLRQLELDGGTKATRAVAGELRGWTNGRVLVFAEPPAGAQLQPTAPRNCSFLAAGGAVGELLEPLAIREARRGGKVRKAEATVVFAAGPDVAEVLLREATLFRQTFGDVRYMRSAQRRDLVIVFSMVGEWVGAVCTAPRPSLSHYHRILDTTGRVERLVLRGEQLRKTDEADVRGQRTARRAGPSM